MVYEAAQLHLLLLTTVADVAVGCAANVLDFFAGIKDMVILLNELGTDPLAYLREQFDAFKLMYEAAKVDAVAFATEVFEGAFELDLARDQPARWAGKFGCQLAVGLFTGGGSLFASLGAKVNTMRKLIDKLNDFVDGRPGLNRLDDRHADRLERDQVDGRNDGPRDEADSRPDDDQPGGICLVGNNSFPTGTPVVMADGSLRPIELVEPGDEVLGADPRTGRWRPQVVLDQWSQVHIGRMATATLIDGSSIAATDDHQFWVANEQAWLELSAVRPGHRFLAPSGAVDVASVAVGQPRVVVEWDLDVGPDDSFVVRSGTNGLLVHNEEGDGCLLDGLPADIRQQVIDTAERLGVSPEYVAKLAPDGAKKGDITEKTIREAEVGIRLELDGVLPGPLVRDPTPAAEFYDAAGRLWDVKAFDSRDFDIDTILRSIQREFTAKENVIIDTKNLNYDDFSALVDAIDAHEFSPELELEWLLED